ncbi:MAG: hypothetical protein ACR2KF_03135 [Nitrososphaeraceae archaeon]
MSIDTSPRFINFVNDVVKLQQIEFNLGLSSAIKIPIPDSRQIKTGITPNPIFEQKLEEWSKRDLKREQEIRKLYKKIDKLCDGIDKPDSVIKTELKLWIKKTDGYFKLETIKKYIDTTCDYHEKELEDAWVHPLMCHMCGKTKLKWDEKVDGKWFSNKEPIIYPKDKKWIEERNDAIFNIREKFMGRNNTWHSYEHLPAVIYKTPQDKKAFLDEVTKFGLIKNVSRVESDPRINAAVYIDEVERAKLYSPEDEKEEELY